jgi:hypothetical protein
MHRRCTATQQLNSCEVNIEFSYKSSGFHRGDFFYQYSETNVMHFLFSLLRIKGLYMFRALHTHPQEACVLCQLAAPGAGN